MEFDFAGAQTPELRLELVVGQKLHAFQQTPETRRGNNVNDRAVVPRDRHQCAGLGRADGSRSLALKVFDAVCIFHAKTMYSVLAVSTAGLNLARRAIDAQLLEPSSVFVFAKPRQTPLRCSLRPGFVPGSGASSVAKPRQSGR